MKLVSPYGTKSSLGIYYSILKLRFGVKSRFTKIEISLYVLVCIKLNRQHQGFLIISPSFLSCEVSGKLYKDRRSQGGLQLRQEGAQTESGIQNLLSHFLSTFHNQKFNRKCRCQKIEYLGIIEVAINEYRAVWYYCHLSTVTVNYYWVLKKEVKFKSPPFSFSKNGSTHSRNDNLLRE